MRQAVRSILPSDIDRWQAKTESRFVIAQIPEGVERTKTFERIPTGIPGLDEMTGGGLPFPSLTLVAGDIGSGKTTFCMQFLCKGAELNEPGLYFTIIGGPPEWLFKFISTYEFVEEKYFGNEIKHIDLGKSIDESSKAEDVLGVIHAEILRFHPKRVVIDSISALEDILKDDYKRFLLKLARTIKDFRVAALVMGEAVPGVPYPVNIANLADAVIVLHNTEVDLVRRRSIEILKMRGTSHPSGKHAIDITTNGLTVYPDLQL